MSMLIKEPRVWDDFPNKLFKWIKRKKKKTKNYLRLVDIDQLTMNFVIVPRAKDFLSPDSLHKMTHIFA